MHLTVDFFSSLRPSKHFPPPSELNDENITSLPPPSLDFDSTGEFLVASFPSSDTIQLFGCEEGVSKNVLPSKKYGVGQIKFAHRSTTVIHTSTKGDDSKQKCYYILMTQYTLIYPFISLYIFIYSAFRCYKIPFSS